MSKKLDLMTAWATSQRARGKHVTPVIDEPEEILDLEERLLEDEIPLDPVEQPKINRVAEICKKLGIG